MVYKADKQRLKRLLMDAISLLCKNGLPVQAAFRIEATIGITLSEDEVVLVSFREVVQPDGVTASQIEGSEEEIEEAGNAISDEDGGLIVENEKSSEARSGTGPSSKVKKRLPRVRNQPLQVTKQSSREELTSENAAWKNAATEENSGGNSRGNLVSEEPNRPLYREEISCYSDSAQVNCSFVEDGDDLASNADVPPRIKDEAMDDDDCTFVKVEDGAGALAHLAQSSSWMYQEVYDESHLYGAANNQSVPRQNYPPGELANCDAPPWSADSHDAGRSTHMRRRGMAATDGGAGIRTGVRQNLPGSSRNQMMLGICQNIVNNSTVEEGRHVCGMCSAKLSNIQTLRNHVKKTHLALKIERCRTCGAAFRWASQLARHKKREHGLDPIPYAYFSDAEFGAERAPRDSCDGSAPRDSRAGASANFHGSHV